MRYVAAVPEKYLGICAKQNIWGGVSILATHSGNAQSPPGGPHT